MISAIVLAAGQSTRMGQPKLMLEVAGKNLLKRVLENLANADVAEVIVVLGSEAEAVNKEIVGFEAKIVENKDYKEGLSTSLRIGLEAIDARAEAAIILLGDQPLVTAEIINQLIQKYRETHRPIVAPLYNGRRGNPVLFARSLFPELMSVTGDKGGREVIAKHKKQVATISIASEMAGLDVDTWPDYQMLCHYLAHQNA